MKYVIISLLFTKGKDVIMSRGTEKFFNGFEQFIANKEIESDEELNEILQQYMSQYNSQVLQQGSKSTLETADDFLALAEEADNEKEALKYAKKALKLEPDNIDAQTAVAVKSATTVEATVEKLKAVYISATAQMKEQGFFEDENIGEFWLISGTRPYMRLLDTYSDVLYNCGKMKLAAEILREMLRLCENDNLGARYTLMHIYCHLEDEESALELAKKYPDDDSVQILLPLSMLFYKLDDLKKSASYLRKIRSTNEDAVDFFSGIINGDLDNYIDEKVQFSYGYRPYTMDEMLVEFEQHKMMYLSVPAYFDWVYRKIKGSSKKK